MKTIVLTCDKYRWLLPIFSYFYEKYWLDNPYRIEVVTEVNHINGAVYYAGRESWASRLITYLKQSKEDKILFTIDDYLLKAKVDTDRVRVAESLCTGNVGCVRLSNCPYKYFRKHTANSFVVKGFREYPLEERFSMVVHIAFFQKAFLLDILRDGEDVWQTEGEGSIRLKKMKSKWKVLWPEIDIINYTSNGGLMKKGNLRPQTLKWALSKLSNSGEVEQKLFEIIQGKKILEKRNK